MAAPSYDQRYQAPEARGQQNKTKQATKDSAVVSRARLQRQRGGVERFTAFLVLFLSFIGSVVALHGGWTPFLTSVVTLKPNWAALLLGIALQLILTYLEWHYFDRPAIAWSARLVDAGTTALGYGPLFIVPLAAALTSKALPQGDIAAWCIIGIISLLVAWYPENRLVE